mgnify:CR=1 FL=1
MKKLKSFFSGMYLTLIFIFLYAPIVTLIIFSFNKGKGSRWKGFSLKWYEDLFESRMIMEALDMLAQAAWKQEEDFLDGQGMSGELSKEAKKELFLRNQDKGYEH